MLFAFGFSRLLWPVLLFAALCQVCYAHNDEPQHGGVLQVVKDVAYELVSDANGSTIHVTDHGDPVSTAGIVGKLIVLDGTRNREFDLRPKGANQLLAIGAHLTSAARATAQLNMPSGRKVVVQFPGE